MSNNPNPTSLDELVELIYEILEPNAAFMNRGTNDRTRYSLDSDSTMALTWLITAIVLPIVTGFVSTVLAELVKTKLIQPPSRLRKRLRIPPRFDEDRIPIFLDDINTLKREVIEIERRLTETKAAPKEKDEAEAIARAILIANGWPSELANRDAIEIVEVTITKVKAIYGNGNNK